jgi:alpha-beta hydrolase superfamily lysophospholipase
MRLLLSLVLLAFAFAAHAAAPTRHEVLADGHVLALWEKRAATPRATVLLVHGRTWSALPNFDLQVAGPSRSVLDGFVRAGYAAYALDLRGYGGTARDATGWLTPDRAAEDVRSALEWIRKKNPSLKAAPALVGYSRGSYVALLMAQRHPDALSSLVLYGFTTVGFAPDPPAETPARAANTAKAAASDFITPEAAPQAVIDAYIRQALEHDPIRVDWRDESRFAFEPARVRMPTLLIYGARDPRYSSDGVARLFGSLGTEDRSLVVLPRSDHAAHVENTHAAWLHAILEFIDRPRE